MVPSFRNFNCVSSSIIIRYEIGVCVLVTTIMSLSDLTVCVSIMEAMVLIIITSVLNVIDRYVKKGDLSFLILAVLVKLSGFAGFNTL